VRQWPFDRSKAGFAGSSHATRSPAQRIGAEAGRPNATVASQSIDFAETPPSRPVQATTPQTESTCGSFRHRVPGTTLTTTQRDQEVPARVVVRVLDAVGAPVGAGFVIGPDLVATCAHVLAAAMRGDPYGAAAPAQPVNLDFPLLIEADLDGPARATAEVARWIPIAPDGSGDITVLRVRTPLPDGARMPPLRRVDQLWDHPFRVLGVPAEMADGVWATGRLRSRQGTRWFQMQSSAGEQPIVQGFSGSPVWDADSGAVVGMTVASDVGGTTTAYLVPIDQVLGVDPELLPCPYRGLEPFGEEHAEYFFGREDDIDRLVDVIGRRRLVAVTGPSGAGKSSLVHAGLLPRLRAQGVAVAELRPLPGRRATEALQVALQAADQPRARLVLVVDQFEELAATDPDAARELLEQIGELVRSAPDDGHVPVHAVVTLRSATLDEVVVPELAGLLGEGTVFVPRWRAATRSCSRTGVRMIRLHDAGHTRRPANAAIASYGPAPGGAGCSGLNASPRISGFNACCMNASPRSATCGSNLSTGQSIARARSQEWTANSAVCTSGGNATAVPAASAWCQACIRSSA
jgi:hypothetical protein